MKNSLLIAFISVCTISFGQDKKLFLDLHVGARLGGYHADSSKLAPGLHADAGLGYMFNNVWGIKGSLGFDQFSSSADLASGSVSDKSSIIRANVELVADLDADRGLTDRKFDWMFHAGIGLASQFNSAYKESLTAAGKSLNDPLIKGNDDMISFIFGLTPQYNINESLKIDIDLSAVFLPLSDGFVDKTIQTSRYKGMYVLFNPSIGIHFKL